MDKLRVGFIGAGRIADLLALFAGYMIAELASAVLDSPPALLV